MKKEICKICGELTVLSKHIRKHNLTTKEYYDKYLKKDNEGICPVCNKLYTNVIGGASKLFKHFLVDHPEIKEVISFADKRWSNGNLYEKLNFKLVNISKPSYFYVIDKIRYNRINFQKHKLINNTNNLSEHDYMFNNKFYRIYDCGSLKYKFVR